MINKLYSDYFQKSKVFLLPQLGFNRGDSIKPLATYMAWDGIFVPEDCKLICVYRLKSDKEFLKYEGTKLLKHRLFHSFYETQFGEGVYVFDFSEERENVINLLDGKYSKLTENFKKNILKYFSNSGEFNEIMKSYLYPEDYYEEYARLLKCDASILKEVGELCDIPDIKQETTNLVVKRESDYELQ